MTGHGRDGLVKDGAGVGVCTRADGDTCAMVPPVDGSGGSRRLMGGTWGPGGCAGIPAHVGADACPGAVLAPGAAAAATLNPPPPEDEDPRGAADGMLFKAGPWLYESSGAARTTSTSSSHTLSGSISATACSTRHAAPCSTSPWPGARKGSAACAMPHVRPLTAAQAELQLHTAARQPRAAARTRCRAPGAGADSRAVAEVLLRLWRPPPSVPPAAAGVCAVPDASKRASTGDASCWNLGMHKPQRGHRDNPEQIQPRSATEKGKDLSVLARHECEQGRRAPNHM